MADGAVESIHRPTEDAPIKRSSLPRIFAMKDFFVPRAEAQTTARAAHAIETQVPAIRVEIRPNARQEHDAAEARRIRQAKEARIQQRLARIRAESEALRYKAMIRRVLEREERDMEGLKKALALGVSSLGVVGILGGAAAVYLSFQSVLASLEAFATVAPIAALEGIHAFLGVLAAGDPTLTAATAFVGFSLLLAATNAAVSGAKVRAQRREYGY